MGVVKYSLQQRKRWIKTLDGRASSTAVLIEDTDGRLLVLKAHYKRYWSTPGGMIDAGESPLAGAIRETREEVNLHLTRHQLEFKWVAYRKSTELETYQFVFKSKVPIDSDSLKIELQASEIDKYEWVSREDILAGGRHYAKAVIQWARGGNPDGYAEQTYTN